jgi:IS5 family transposase
VASGDAPPAQSTEPGQASVQPNELAQFHLSAGAKSCLTQSSVNLKAKLLKSCEESQFWASKAGRLRLNFGVKPLMPKHHPPLPEPTMRQERTVQARFDLIAGHEIGRALKAMSIWLDKHRALLGLVAADLRRRWVKATGRHGLPAESVLRCALLKQYRQLSYQELAFHLEDSASFRAFARWTSMRAFRPTASACCRCWSATARSMASRRGRRRRRQLCQPGGVRDMAFHKKGGLGTEDMVRSRWGLSPARNFRAGIEADLSCLKRAHGLARCTWRGLGYFRA